MTQVLRSETDRQLEVARTEILLLRQKLAEQDLKLNQNQNKFKLVQVNFMNQNKFKLVQVNFMNQNKFKLVQVNFIRTRTSSN